MSKLKWNHILKNSYPLIVLLAALASAGIATSHGDGEGVDLDTLLSEKQIVQNQCPLLGRLFLTPNSCSEGPIQSFDAQ